MTCLLAAVALAANGQTPPEQLVLRLGEALGATHEKLSLRPARSVGSDDLLAISDAVDAHPLFELTTAARGSTRVQLRHAQDVVRVRAVDTVGRVIAAFDVAWPSRASSGLSGAAAYDALLTYRERRLGVRERDGPPAFVPSTYARPGPAPFPGAGWNMPRSTRSPPAAPAPRWRIVRGSGAHVSTEALARLMGEPALSTTADVDAVRAATARYNARLREKLGLSVSTQRSAPPGP